MYVHTCTYTSMETLTKDVQELLHGSKLFAGSPITLQNVDLDLPPFASYFTQRAKEWMNLQWSEMHQLTYFCAQTY